jgi:hypothetical protein
VCELHEFCIYDRDSRRYCSTVCWSNSPQWTGYPDSPTATALPVESRNQESTETDQPSPACTANMTTTAPKNETPDTTTAFAALTVGGEAVASTTSPCTGTAAGACKAHNVSNL